MRFQISFLFLLFSVHIFSQSADIDSIIQRQMKDQKITGLSLAIVRDGKTLIDKGYGIANLEHNVEVTSQTVFRLASISKQFFATAIMKLVEEGKLSLDDDMHKFFPKSPKDRKSTRLNSSHQ